MSYPVVLLTIVGVVLLGIVIILALTILWCAGADNAMNVKACGEGHFKDVAIALIGAVASLWGAYQLKKG